MGHSVCIDDSTVAATISPCIHRVTLAAPDVFLQIGLQSESSKPAIWIDAGIHAREWIAPATAVYLIHAVSCMQMTQLHGQRFIGYLHISTPATYYISLQLDSQIGLTCMAKVKVKA